MRNKTIALCCTAFPVGFGAYYAFALPDGSSPQLWALIISLQLMTVFGFTIYFTATATLTSRREDRYLKRLRSGEMTAPTVLTGLLLPVVLLGVAQAAALLAIAFWLGAPLPSDPLPLLAAMLAGSALCVAAGAVTSVFTATGEQAQITTLPGFVVLFGSGVWQFTGQSFPGLLLLPGAAFQRPGAAVDERRAGKLGGVPALLVLLGWTAVLAVLAARKFAGNRGRDRFTATTAATARPASAPG